MKILSITNNYGLIEDGIGYYSKNIITEMEKDGFDFEILTNKTIGLSKIRRILSLKMSKCFSKAKKMAKAKAVDKIIIEYPFVEENPLIMHNVKALHRKCKKNNIELILSIHEYLRVHKIKKFYIRSMCKHVDKILVTDDNNLEALQKYNKNIYTRRIPTGIKCEFKNEYKKDFSKFVYFGLVNSSKAFEEMINAWKKFNVENKYYLEILTASRVDIQNDDSIKIYTGLSDEEIAEHMNNASFSILPIKPEVYLNNTSFITSLQAGCICIGKINERIRNESYMVNLDSYELEDFVAGLNKSTSLISKETYNKAQKFGNNFTIKSVADEIEEIIQKELLK